MELVRRAGFDEDHDTFRDSVRRFVPHHVGHDLDRWRAEGGFDTALLAAAGEQGFLGTGVPEELGGAGVDDPLFPTVLVEELARSGATGLALVVARQLGVVVPTLVAAAGDSEQAGEWLAGVAAGEFVGCVAVLTPEGTAYGVPGAAVADVFVLVDPAQPDRVAIRSRDAITVQPTRQLGGTESAAADVTAATGVDGDPVAHDSAVLVPAALDLWSSVVGLAAATVAVDLAVDYVQERAVFGRPLSTFENTRFRLAEVAAELTAGRHLVDIALAALADGTLTPALAAATRIVVERVHDQAVDQGMQLHGGYGYMREYPISWAFSDARFVKVASAASGEPRHALAAALGL